MRRLRELTAIIALVALPGTCLSEALPPKDLTSPLAWQRLPEPSPDDRKIASGLEWEAGWELASRNYYFDGYSALIARRDGSLLAASDRGQLLELRPDASSMGRARFIDLPERALAGKHFGDQEAIHEDAASGALWIAIERRNAILRFDSRQHLTGWSKPAPLAHWESNGGPEAMTRLADGRFLVIAESPRRLFGDTHEAVLFAGDPVEKVSSQVFLIDMPEGFRPVEVAALPDESLAILLRRTRLSLSPGFESAILFGRLVTSGEVPRWQNERVTRLGNPIPPENYEGMAVRPMADGSAEIWLISDNNRSVFQHTYLIKLRWRPDEETRGKPARLLLP